MPSEQQEEMVSLTLPAILMRWLKEEAEREGRSIAAMLEQVLRDRHVERMRKAFAEDHEYVKTLPPTPYTEEDVPRLVKEIRREMAAEREK